MPNTRVTSTGVTVYDSDTTGYTDCSFMTDAWCTDQPVAASFSDADSYANASLLDDDTHKKVETRSKCVWCRVRTVDCYTCDLCHKDVHDRCSFYHDFYCTNEELLVCCFKCLDEQELQQQRFRLYFTKPNQKPFLKRAELLAYYNVDGEENGNKKPRAK